VENRRLILKFGGLAAAQEKMLSQRGREAKIAYLKRFKGIGDKYARNIWMDMYDRDFQETIAIDSRIGAILKAIGVQGAYDQQESGLREVAREAGLQPWELDRILYWYYREACEALGIQKRSTSRRFALSACGSPG
jgi:hypothetical protein